MHVGVDVYLRALQRNFSRYFNELGNFNFSLFNPLFWIFFLIAFLILSRLWKYRKAFSFCLTVTIVLFISAWAEKAVVNFFVGRHETFDPVLTRMGTFIVITFILLYYFFVKGDE